MSVKIKTLRSNPDVDKLQKVSSKKIFNITIILILLCLTGGCEEKSHITPKPESVIDYEVKVIEVEEESKPERDHREVARKYLNSTVEEIMKETGAELDRSSSLVVFQPTVFFPTLFLEDERIVILCGSRDPSERPVYVSYYVSDA